MSCFHLFELKKYTPKLMISVVMGLFLLFFISTQVHAQSLSDNFHGTASSQGSTGIEGTITSPPPSSAASIAVPTNGQNFGASGPITVSGLCTSNDLVKLFSNGVFIGAAQCSNGSYSITTSLFSGQNQLSAEIFDSLNQEGPTSNLVTVTVTLSSSLTFPSVLLTSGDAKIGSTPGQAFTWPITVSGGLAPYAISIDWGDNTSSDLLSEKAAGTFLAEHTYASAGIYSVLVKATDQSGTIAYLQLVGVGNGPLAQVNKGTISGASNASTKTEILWEPAAFLVPLIIIAFWLGRKFELAYLRRHLSQPDVD
jgi:hypothetical protein